MKKMREKNAFRPLAGTRLCSGCLPGIALLLSLLFSGCSSDEGLNAPDDGLVAIRLNGGIGSISSFRTRGEGMFSGTDSWSSDLAVCFARADKADGIAAYTGYLTDPLVAVVRKEATGGEGAKTHAITFGTVATPVPAYYLTDGGSSKLIGWYPATGTFSQSAHTVTFPAAILDGSTDLMVTDLYEGNKASGITAVAFNHLLTQISVRVYTESDATAAVWGTLSAITIAGMKQSCTVTLPAATAAVTGGTEKVTVDFPASSEALPLVQRNPSDNSSIAYPEAGLALGVGSGNAVLAGYAMFAPQVSETPSEDPVTLSLSVVTAVGGTHTATVQAPGGGFQAGYSYAVTLKFGAAGIAPSVSITDWQTGTAPGEVQL